MHVFTNVHIKKNLIKKEIYKMFRSKKETVFKFITNKCADYYLQVNNGNDNIYVQNYYIVLNKTIQVSDNFNNSLILKCEIKCELSNKSKNKLGQFLPKLLLSNKVLKSQGKNGKRFLQRKGNKKRSG